MKWLLIACFLLWARHGEGGALKCLTESEDPPCPSENQEIEPQDLVVNQEIEPQGLVEDPDTSTSNPEPLEVECLPGSEWESNCHSCSCSSEGAAECRKQSSCDSPNTEPIRCKPNTTFERECNTCTCLENGLGLCTLKNCQRIPARVPSKENLPKGEDCAPGSEWKSGCNDCVCTPEGLRLCSSLGCPEGQESAALLRCAPHSLWKRECNTCWCTSDGRAMCTKIGCAGIPSEMHFKDEENEYDSLENVKPDRLSNTKAVDNVLIELKGSDHTINIDKPGKEQDEYNLTGVALKDLEDFVDNFVTPTKYSRINENLENLDVQELASFSDHKTQDEPNFITKNQQRELTTEEINELETSYTNQNNLNVRVDSDLNGAINELDKLELETRDDINRVNQNVHHAVKRSVCKPNQDFESDCNTCKCSATGQSYACTQNECMDKDKEDVDKEVEVFMESEGVDHIERHSVCKPSEIFYIQCNPCHCNADGTDFSCTNKPCPPPDDVEVFHEPNDKKPIIPFKSGETPNKISERL